MQCTVVFHDDYYDYRYASDPAAAPGRLERIISIVDENTDLYRKIEAVTATEEDILRAHSPRHLKEIKEDPLLFRVSSLSAGGAIIAAEEAYRGNPSFAVIRPPGHHASADTCWGFCYFNNISVSLLKLFADKKITSAFVLDFDLHTGDGNINILQEYQQGLKATILNPSSTERKAYLKEVENFMKELPEIDIMVAAAGFDQGITDWGNLLYPEDYTRLGELMKQYSELKCEGRRYALLEGGYNHEALAENFHSFCKGFVGSI